MRAMHEEVDRARCIADVNLGPKWPGVRCSFKATWVDDTGRGYCGIHAKKASAPFLPPLRRIAASGEGVG
jgi:hypothetical protein